MQDLERRHFMISALGAVALGGDALAMQTPGPNGIPMRPLGKSGASVSMVGLGGWDSVANKTDAESVKLMHEALDSGIFFWDNCWEYHDGRAEKVMGQALAEPGVRGRVFLMTKTCARDYEGARKQIDESLARLRTDHVDLLQFHAMQYPGDPQRVFDPEKGALKAALEAKKAGKLRYLGFSGHMDPQVHLAMLGMPYEWDSVQMPLNIMDAHYLSFQKQVLPVLQKRRIGALGMKSLAGQEGRIPKDLKVNWELCRRYAMSLPVSAVICGLQTSEELQGIVRIAKNFKPLTEEEAHQLLAVSEAPAADGHIEEYKNRKGGYGCSYFDAVLKKQA